MEGMFRCEKKFYKFDRNVSQTLANKGVGGEISPKVPPIYNRGELYGIPMNCPPLLL